MKETTTINNIGIKDRYVWNLSSNRNLSDHARTNNKADNKDGLTANLLY